jgi:uncharacterized membrane protein YqaE (UPF0057 family)
VYLLAVIFPPAAVLMCGKPFQALIACFLTLCIFFPGVIYAFAVVAEHKADRRNDKLIRAVSGRRSSARYDAPAESGDPFAF